MGRRCAGRFVGTDLYVCRPVSALPPVDPNPPTHPRPPPRPSTHTGPAVMAAPDSLVARRAEFARKQLWVTPHVDGQRYAAGEHVVQSEACMGLGVWTAQVRGGGKHLCALPGGPPAALCTPSTSLSPPTHPTQPTARLPPPAPTPTPARTLRCWARTRWCGTRSASPTRPAWRTSRSCRWR